MKYPEIKLNTLSNEIPIYSVRYTEYAKFSIYFFVNVGSVFEDKSVLGLSHFLEHMTFKKTSKFKSAIQLASYLEKYGITFNAYTNKVKTCYYFKGPSTLKNLERICDVAKEMLFHMEIKDKDLEIERNIIRQEYNSGKDDITDIFYNLMEQHYFNNHPLDNNVIGSITTINKITKDDIINFYQKYYTPDNIKIGVIGNVPKNYLNLLNKVLGHLPKKYNLHNKNGNSKIYSNPINSISKSNKKVSQKLHLDEEKNISEQELFLRREKNHTTTFGMVKPYNERQCKTTITYYKINESHQSQLGFLFGGKSITHKDSFMINTIADMIGGSGRYSNKFFDLIREKYGLSYHIKTGQVQYIEGGFMYIYVKVNHKDIGQTIKVISKELKNYTKLLITKDELKEFKTNFISRFDSLLESYDSLEEVYLDDLIYKFKEFNLQDYLEKIRKLTVDDINKFASQFLQKNNYQVIVLQPKNKK